MGQGGSSDRTPPTPEEVSLHLTNTFAKKCLKPLELHAFKQNFKLLADTQSSVQHIPQGTISQFLELPDELNIAPALFQLCSYLGAFPFPSQAPAILTNDALLRVVVILTGRFAKILGGGKAVWRKEIWRGLAVFDRALDSTESQGKPDRDLTCEEDALVRSAFESMDALEVYEASEKYPDSEHAVIPSDNFLRLIELLLLMAPLEPQQSVSELLKDTDLKELRQTAKCILGAFAPEQAAGVSYKVFDRIAERVLPFMFDPLQILFEQFLFTKGEQQSSVESTDETTTSSEETTVQPTLSRSVEPLMPKDKGGILTLSLLNQLSTILPGKTIYRRLRPLYLGNEHGFSMGQFEKSCFKWQAPSILLVSGRLIDSDIKSTRARAFLDTLPHQRLGSSAASKSVEGEEQRIIYGAYIPVPWKTTPKACFGTSSTKLFQLSPVHDVFPASEISKHYAYFNRAPSTYPGIGFGSSLPEQSSSAHAASHSSSYGSRSSSEQLPLGPLSLHIDDALEYGVFTHLSSGGGSFHTSILPEGARPAGPRDTINEWQDRFEIDAIEVWGIGGDQEAEAQRSAWDWEAREAEARRKINLGSGDIEMDKEILRMAGLLSERSGGSMA